MQLLIKNKWNIQNRIEGDENLSLLDLILQSKGIINENEKEYFIKPELGVVNDPFLFRDMKIACGLILQNINEKKKIVIFGDYDVDGITSTATLYLFLTTIGADVHYIIPDRITDGYGLTENGIRKIIDTNADLIITVDCGITSENEVESLLQKDIKVIITDHHECKQSLPKACAILNPKRSDSLYPFRNLAGVGVALKLIQGICLTMGLGNKWSSYLDLVALGTVSDLVPLTDENRMFVIHGLNLMNKSCNPGLKCLLSKIAINEKVITESTIGYSISPRINAAGRMGDSMRAVRLLTETDTLVCKSLVDELISDNKKRQEVELKIFDEAKSIIESRVDLLSAEIIVLYKSGWNQGVIGIVASRLVELYHRAVIILSGEEEYYKGSARGTSTVSILDAIEYANNYVYKFGGHKKAAGLVVKHENIREFENAIKEYTEIFLEDNLQERTIEIDFEIPFTAIDLSSAKEISMLSPFGEDNQKPVFAIRNILVQQLKYLSSGKHTKFQLSGNNSSSETFNGTIDAIAFGFAEKDSIVSQGDRVDVAFTIEENDWNGSCSVQLIVKDVRISEDSSIKQNQIENIYRQSQSNLSNITAMTSPSYKELIPQKPDFIAVYQYLKANFDCVQTLCDLDVLAVLIGNNYKISLSAFKLARIFDIFKEVGLLEFIEISIYRIKFRLTPVTEKVNLANSEIYKSLSKESVI